MTEKVSLFVIVSAFFRRSTEPAFKQLVEIAYIVVARAYGNIGYLHRSVLQKEEGLSESLVLDQLRIGLARSFLYFTGKPGKIVVQI